MIRSHYPSSNLPENIGALGDLRRQVLAVVPDPYLVATRDDQLPLALIALLDEEIIMRGAVAEDPKSWLVVEVGPAVDPLDPLLRRIRQTQAVVVEVLDVFCHSGLDPESRVFLDSGFRRNDILCCDLHCCV